MKKQYQDPIIDVTEICAMGFLMASEDKAGGDPGDLPGGFAPGRNKPF